MAVKRGQGVAAGQYARALLELANERGEAETMGEQLHGLRGVVEENPKFGALLQDPAISREERRAVLERVYAGKVSELVMNGLRVLNAKGRLALLPQIAEHYQVMLDEQLGNIKVDVTVAQRMNEAMLEQVRRRISEAMKKNALVTQIVDESIIGGMVVKIEDRLIDGSAKAQLEAMKRQLMMAVAK